MIGAYTSLGMLSEVLGGTGSWAYGQAAGIKSEISNLPELRNVNAFDENGEWTIDGVGEFVSYLSTNLAQSAPIMGITIASVLAAKPTGGASLAIPLSIYTGQNYDAQDEKNMARAIGFGVLQTGLDIVGVKGGGALANKFFSGQRKDCLLYTSPSPRDS